MALGQTIVSELKLDARGEVLERWLAHHLAELMSEADQAVGPAKIAAQQQAVDIILKLWAHRRALPEQVDPLGGFRDAIQVLGRLMPEANPWRRLQRHGSYEDLLHEMFETMCQVVLGGVLLTQVKHTRAISESELNVLENEEILLQEGLDRWLPFFVQPAELPKINVVYVDASASEESTTLEACDEVNQEQLTPEQQMDRAKASAHEAITANLERMHTKLASLIKRWKIAAPDSFEPDEDLADS